MNEESGLPAQISLWGELHDGIQQCIDAINEMIEGLNKLESFELSVTFSSEAAGTTGGDSSSAAHAFGTFSGFGYAFANGSNIGLNTNQRALIGEQGYEGLVRGNRFSLIGQHGAEFMDLKRGDIIFSHAQTKQLLKTGRIGGRGRTIGGGAYADGTLFNSAVRFAGNDSTMSNLNMLASQLLGGVTSVDTAVNKIASDVAVVSKSFATTQTSSAMQDVNISIGDIHLSGVQNPDGLAQAIKSYLPGKLLQELHK